MVCLRNCFSFILLLLFTSCGNNEPRPLSIAGAANLRLALEELSKDFTARTGTPTQLIFASSGKLTAQIKAGAPYDVFLSADERYPADLAAAGLTVAEPITYAHGQLALWTTATNIPLNPDSLLLPRIRRIAIANPVTAPYGQAALDLLQQWGLDETLRDKLVYGESVGQTNQFVYSGSADIGISALSTVITGEQFLKYTSLDGPLVQQAAVALSASPRQRESIAFMDYLQSLAAATILQKYGYLVPE